MVFILRELISLLQNMKKPLAACVADRGILRKENRVRQMVGVYASGCFLTAAMKSSLL